MAHATGRGCVGLRPVINATKSAVDFVGGKVAKEVAGGKRLAPKIDGYFDADDWLFKAVQNRAV
ncbi:hypothetical protein GCM10023156_57420 [Novipirellula rosea]|uniref:Uncharacterized protein n=1 Tax=Novipirellula rosea TaxID=1031540 RepID=A0ABP8NKV0_9BACT